MSSTSPLDVMPRSRSARAAGPTSCRRRPCRYPGVLPLMLAGVRAMLTGLLVVCARPGWASARAFFFAGWASALQLTVLPFDTFVDGRLLPASYAVGALFFGSVLCLALSFPVRRWPLTRHPVLGPVALYGALALPWLWSAFSHGRPWVPLDTTVRALYIPTCYALCLPLLANTAATLWWPRDAAERRRARLVLPAALLLAALVPLSELWNEDRIPLVLRVGVAVAGVSGMGIVVALATLKHDMLELGPRVRRGLVRVSLVALTVVAYVALHAAAQRWAGMGSSWATGVVAGLLVIALTGSLASLRRRVEQHVEELLFPGQRRARELLRRVSQELAELRDPEGVAPVVRRAIEERVGSVRILVGGSEGGLRELSPKPAAPRLLSYRWPGNVRELRNVIERAVVLSRGPRVSLPEPLDGLSTTDAVRSPALGDDFRLEDELLRYKRSLVEQALRRVGGNHRRAAELLGLQRSSLTRMVHRLGLTRPRP